MFYLLCRNRVADFTKWKKVFDSHQNAHRDAGLYLVHFWRELDDPDNIFFVFQVSNIDTAKAFINAPEAKKADKTAGVIDSEIHFLENNISNF